ncbi:DUF1376 domain-containing protein [Rhizobium mesoamericanum]|uniref:DUF1376 domain-containing protein n=1 Tax=Rhizobium mesoamericanum TaxID=1079800 RepID=UPI0003F5CE20|nr:DUF1376 domain-containing protein [Rhizobium mesoamericanum]
MSPDYVPDYRHCLLPYVQWFQDDFLGGIRGMKAQEIGIYTVLLNEMYNRGVALDQSDERLARMCGADVRVFKRVLADLIDDEKIIRLNRGLWNVRCENAFTSRAEMLKKQSEAGKQSAKKRRKNKEGFQRTLSERSTGDEPISEAQIIVKETPNGVSKKRASRLAADWVPPAEWIDEAVDKGMPRSKALAEAERMKNWSLSHPKGAKLDWLATWRNWYRDKLDNTSPPPRTTKAKLFERM